VFDFGAIRKAVGAFITYAGSNFGSLQILRAVALRDDLKVPSLIQASITNLIVA
jgi:hypothetical protein